jgi:hypothetical protein
VVDGDLITCRVVRDALFDRVDRPGSLMAGDSWQLVRPEAAGVQEQIRAA